MFMARIWYNGLGTGDQDFVAVLLRKCQKRPFARHSKSSRFHPVVDWYQAVALANVNAVVRASSIRHMYIGTWRCAIARG